jgi:pyruvate dehydrogenase E2 component (dihydrolipoamide acetyltransferase)
MATEIIVPRLGWDMEEGAFGGWLKQDGDTIAPGDVLFTLESEKATEDIESLDGGILRIPPDGPKTGARVEVGMVIGYLVAPGEEPPVPTAHGTKAGAGQEAPPIKRATHQSLVREPLTTHPPLTTHHPTISPRAKRIATELGIDWVKVQGTGQTGRIRECDIRAAQVAVAGGDEIQIIAIDPVRKAIAARMLRSVQSTAPVTLTTCVDATNLVNLRDQFKTAPATGEPIPSYTDFFVKLAAAALVDYPMLNARRDGDRIVISRRIHIGVAVDTEAGLVVPVVRDVPGLGLRQLAARTRDLIERARRRKLKAEEMQGGTFTVTSLGAFDIDAFTPIINFPECAILGVGRIKRRPAVVDDQIMGREQVTLSLTFDHSIVDGAPAARFLQVLGKLVENPGPRLIS